jgi:hypothetical protein
MPRENWLRIETRRSDEAWRRPDGRNRRAPRRADAAANEEDNNVVHYGYFHRSRPWLIFHLSWSGQLKQPASRQEDANLRRWAGISKEGGELMAGGTPLSYRKHHRMGKIREKELGKVMVTTAGDGLWSNVQRAVVVTFWITLDEDCIWRDPDGTICANCSCQAIFDPADWDVERNATPTAPSRRR